MRIPSFNVENLFNRARALTLPREQASEILERHARINGLLGEPVYSDSPTSIRVHLPCWTSSASRSPVVLGSGARLFDNLGDPTPRLEQVQAIEAPGVTHIRYTRV